MRIAMVTRTSRHVGGIETYVALATERLSARGHRVRVVAEDEDAHPAIGAGHGPVPARLIERVRTFVPDVVLSHGLSDPAVERGVVDEWPTAFFAHVYHGTCVGGAKTLGWPTPRPCGRPLGPACLAHYFPRRCGGLNPVTMVRQFDLQRRRLAVVKECQAVIALSQHIADEYARNGVRPARIHRLSPVVDLPHTVADRPATWDVHLVYIGRLERLKGPRFLLDALRGLPVRLNRRVRATFAGEGLEAVGLERCAEAVGRLTPAVSVAFTGKLERTALRALLDTATLLVVPSLWPEPFCLVGLEAAASGVPAVGFDVGGIPEWLRDGVTGHLARRRASAASLQDAIVRALEEPSHYAALRRGARAAAERAAGGSHFGQLERVLEAIARPGVALHT